SDVLSALADPNTSEQPVFVGTPTPHAVAACSLSGPQAASASVAAASRSVSEEKMQAAITVRNTHAAELLSKYPVESVGVGVSLDQPGEAALLLFVNSFEATQAFPQTIAGIPTRIVQLSSRPTAQILSAAESVILAQATSYSENINALSDTELSRASAVKSQRGAQLLKRQGVQGVGVGASADHAGEAALVIFTVRGITH